MPRIFTPPDMEFDRTIPKVLIRNCPWTNEEIAEILKQLTDKDYDIYLYNNSHNDVQWMEGIRSMSQQVFDYKHYQDQDPVQWLRSIDDMIK